MIRLVGAAVGYDAAARNQCIDLLAPNRRSAWAPALVAPRSRVGARRSHAAPLGARRGSRCARRRGIRRKIRRLSASRRACPALVRAHQAWV